MVTFSRSFPCTTENYIYQNKTDLQYYCCRLRSSFSSLHCLFFFWRSINAVFFNEFVRSPLEQRQNFSSHESSSVTKSSTDSFGIVSGDYFHPAICSFHWGLLCFFISILCLLFPSHLKYIFLLYFFLSYVFFNLQIPVLVYQSSCINYFFFLILFTFLKWHLSNLLYDV